MLRCEVTTSPFYTILHKVFVSTLVYILFLINNLGSFISHRHQYDIAFNDTKYMFFNIASYGSKEEALIDELNLKSANVVFHPSETNLPIDNNEYYAINDKGSFSLLLHGTQKQGSAGSEAIKKMNKEKIKYSYSKK